MSVADASAICTLLALIFAGPLVYWVRHLYNTHYRVSKPTKDEVEMLSHNVDKTDNEEADNEVVDSEEEMVSSNNYLLGLLGYAIGIGNVWRFPYLVGQYGGGAFVFAYLVCLLLVAMPLYLVELGLGQYTRVGAIETLTMIRPRWRALGWAQVIMVAVIIAYYNVLLAYTCIYIVASCEYPLPWENSGSETYWNEEVLNSYRSGSALGGVQWKLALSLIFVYLLVFLAVGFGKKMLSKITWITVVGPVLLMIILFFRTIILPGAANGIAFYIGKFDWSELASGELWATACGQIIFSLSPGCGTAIALSSNIKPKEDVYRTCIIVGLCNSSFSLFGGFAIFSILGNLALESDQSVSELASQSGTGLAFISIADGITNFGSASNSMAILFFIMLLSLGLDSTFAWLETLIAAVRDVSRANDVKLEHTHIVGILCIVLFLCGLPFCTRGGNNLLDVVDHFVGAWFLLLSCCIEAILINIDFGWDRFAMVIKTATFGNKNSPEGRDISTNPFWKVCALYVVPVATFGLLMLNFIHDAFYRMYGDGDYSTDLVAVGWTIFVLLMVLAAVTMLDKRPGRWTNTDPKEIETTDSPMVSANAADVVVDKA